jgi:nucleoid-associated protein YgaU
VESFDEELYRAKPGDTFPSISQRFYLSERYAQALLLFNRNHPLAAGSLRQEPPALLPGQPVYLPPARILEKYYGAAINNDQTRLAPAAPPDAPPQPPSFASPASFTAPAGNERKYRVRAQGEMLLDIARRTLGTGDRWAEIYQLNPRYDPKEPVPGGTELRLPPDARVDAQDTP